MKTTPDELAMEKKIKKALAKLFSRAISAPKDGSPTIVKVSKAMLRRRKEMTRKFVSGEWGLELSGFEEAQEYDRQKDLEQANRWRD